MTEIYLVRHGETEWNAVQRIQGHTNSNLSELGRRQAAALVRRFTGKRLDAIYSSDLVRAMDTAAPLAAEHGLTVQGTSALREKNYGHWEGRTLDEIKSVHADEWHRYSTLREIGFRIPGAEIWQEIEARVVGFLKDVLAKHSGANEGIALFGHGGSLRLAVLHALQAPLTSISRMKLDNCGFTHLTYDATGLGRVLCLNDTSHLDNCIHTDHAAEADE